MMSLDRFVVLWHHFFMPVTVGLISLGCAKNLIDSEIMMGHLHESGMILTDKVDVADVVIVNTCSFIDKAKKESIDTILGVTEARAKKAGHKTQKIIVAGCLAQRFSLELPALLPEVDAFIGLDQITQVSGIIEKVMSNAWTDKTLVSAKSEYVPEYNTPRYRLTPLHTAYVKIAEGCNHGCAFCAIPSIRGRHRSRTQESVVREVSELVAHGVKEINLIAQDTTYFGMDRWEGARATRQSGVDSSRGESLATLVRALNALEGDFWIRILYTHPAHWSNELIDVVAESDKVAPYIDIPLQHISDNMLKAMNRVTDGAYVRDLVHRMRERIPGLALRSTFIVGFPGEDDDDFFELLDFIEEERFERAGVFTYSKEEGTKAYKMKGQVHHRTKQSRGNECNALLHRIASEVGESQIGKTLKVLVDSAGVARSVWDAPEIDGMVHVDKSLPVGEFAWVKIVDSFGYELLAEGAEIPEHHEYYEWSEKEV